MNGSKSVSLSSAKTVSTSKTELTELTNTTDDDGWKTISPTKPKESKINHLKCVTSPTSSPNQVYNKNSPNYNQYDPEGTIVRRSNRILQKSSQEEMNKDHLSSRTRSSKKGGQKE